MYSTGSCSFSNLADYLNESGFISRSGRAFRDDTLRSMLDYPIYIGIIEYQGTKKETYLTYKKGSIKIGYCAVRGDYPSHYRNL